ncbi:FMN-binding split barrel [Pleurotus pulmonarius]
MQRVYGTMYKLLTSGIVPRPVAFVSSISEAGVKNLAPFSWFNTVTHNPPIISISCSVSVNIISETWIHNANACSMDAPPDVGEWPISGLTPADTAHVKAPRVKESAFSMECELFQAIDIVHPETGETTATLILGRVKYIHVRNDVLTDKRDAVNPTQLRPILRLGDITYAVLGDGFRVPRPSWKDEGEGLQASGILSVHDGKL